MKKDKTVKERRKVVRYKAMEGSYAATSPASSKPGQIVDISMGGLSFEYIDADSTYQNRVEPSESYIYLNSPGYSVEKLPFKTVADYEMRDQPPSGAENLRRRHIKFTDLSLKQMFDLDYYVKKNCSKKDDS